ncbi:zinc ribbon domain-containing protein [Streptomyces mangrovi]|uniref:hypothetical protein n=1 Tax=Streptomyces mangrovi TaxID=1206892 RepID=UPI00399D3183
MSPRERSNPAKVRSFDNTALGLLPEYNQAAHALNKLIHALNKAEVGLSQEQWLTAVRDLTAAIPFMDACNCCRNYRQASAPVKTEIRRDGWMTAYYRCDDCGHRWTCGWATSAPDYL